MANVAGKRVLKVVDFGIAKVIGESVDLQRAHEATGLSLHAFTPRYGAPEQFDRRFGATGPWTDVFALGLILVEMVLGRSAMSGDAAQLFVAASNVQRRPTLRAFGVDEGDEVERVLARALAVDPKERYASAGKLWDELLRVTANAATVLSTSAPPTLPDAALPTAPTALDAPPVPVRRPVISLRDTLAEPPAERGGARWLWPVLGVCAIAAAGAIYAFALPPSDGGEVRGPQATPTATEPSSAAAPDPGAEATVAEPAEAVPAVTPVLCAQGLAPYVNAELGYSLCIPQELAGKEPQDGVLRAGELALTLEAGRLRPPDVTLDRMFARDARSSLEDDDRWILDSETKKTDTWYFLTGKRHGKPFAKRVVITTDRFAGFEIAYPPSQRQAVESKLEHMVPTFAATTGAP